jgi:hypothetical protein
MLKRIRDAWLNALRSGEYTQTSGTLQFDTSYCCLGVLCRVMEDMGLYEPTLDGPGEQEGELRGGLLRDQFAVRELMRKQDTLIGREGCEEPWIEVKLSEMNDCGMSFGKIADYIQDVIPEENDDEAKVVERAASEVLSDNEGPGAPSQEAPLQQEGGPAGVGGPEPTEPA